MNWQLHMSNSLGTICWYALDFLFMFYRLLHDMTTNCSLVRQDLEQNLPLDDIFKSKDVVAAPIRVVQLIYNSGVS